MTLTTLRLSSAGRAVALRDHGTGAPVVLLHGVGMQSAAWAPQIDHLSQTMRVIAVDLPGHGGSDPLPVGSTLQDYVTWCADLLDSLDLGPISLAGHSMGALIAGGYASLYPDRLRRVALLNGVTKRSAAARAAVEARAAAIRAGDIDHAAPLARWFPSAAHGGARAQVKDWLETVDPAGYATAYTAFAQGDATYAADVHRITCPFLALTGTDDLNSTPAMSHAMAARAPHGRAAVIQGHGHMMNLTAPDAVNAHLLTWIKTPAMAQVAS